jgi:hypothetical protein
MQRNTRMTDSPASALAVEIEKVLRGVDGVTAIYSSAPVAEVVAEEVGAAVLPSPAASTSLISVEAGEQGTTVTAVIGVDERMPAHQTGRAAHDHIIDLLARTRVQASVTVRIAMISN